LYAVDVEAGSFPTDAQSVKMDDAVLADVLGLGHDDRPAETPVGIPLDRDL